MPGRWLPGAHESVTRMKHSATISPSPLVREGRGRSLPVRNEKRLVAAHAANYYAALALSIRLRSERTPTATGETPA